MVPIAYILREQPMLLEMSGVGLNVYQAGLLELILLQMLLLQSQYKQVMMDLELLLIKILVSITLHKILGYGLSQLGNVHSLTHWF
jgi:hypothetical protein